MKLSIQFLVFLALSVSSQSHATDIITRGSAAEYIEEFTDIGKSAAKLAGIVPGFPVNEAQFLEVVKTTTIEFTENKLISPQGIEVDALNYPAKKLIRVNWNRWFRYRWTMDNRTQLAIHEYLGILKVDDSKYSWSQYLIKGGRLTSVTTCDYEIEGQPYYLNFNNYGATSALKSGGFDMTSGKGTSRAPQSSEPLAITSVNFRWSDIFKGKLEGIEKWGIGMSWQYKNRSLHARITLKQSTEEGNFDLEIFELNNFDANGVLIPRHFMTISCFATKVKE
ncbi:hypothetical protein DOM22_14110 [Bdellovibrio sp. ZAP7]|uniref:hypothetical protein n=1 Tax=Bdellovibrio sp. ZAP7 TaxID=2231053 RepID=UPI00115A39C2|nr:hypothetical protein [Bdellovibrio sp. ZAP7]QDK46216.1 hypothetical protein DOM22_14110 [Bdellovibrio sp. ZAP7]